MKFYMRILGYRARITFDTRMQMYRGEFTELSSGDADFYATDLHDLHREGLRSIQVYQNACLEEGLVL